MTATTEGMGEITFAHAGKTWRAKCDWQAIFFFEQTANASLVDLFESLATGRPKLSHLAVFVQAVLQRHHAGVDLDTCGQIVSDDGLRAALFELAGNAMPRGDARADAAGNGAGGATA